MRFISNRNIVVALAVTVAALLCVQARPQAGAAVGVVGRPGGSIFNAAAGAAAGAAGAAVGAGVGAASGAAAAAGAAGGHGGAAAGAAAGGAGGASGAAAAAGAAGGAGGAAAAGAASGGAGGAAAAGAAGGAGGAAAAGAAGGAGGAAAAGAASGGHGGASGAAAAGAAGGAGGAAAAGAASGGHGGASGAAAAGAAGGAGGAAAAGAAGGAGGAAAAGAASGGHGGASGAAAAGAAGGAGGAAAAGAASGGKGGSGAAAAGAAGGAGGAAAAGAAGGAGGAAAAGAASGGHGGASGAAAAGAAGGAGGAAAAGAASGGRGGSGAASAAAAGSGGRGGSAASAASAAGGRGGSGAASAAGSKDIFSDNMSQGQYTIQLHQLLNKRKSRWDETPSDKKESQDDSGQDLSIQSVKKSRWDETSSDIPDNSPKSQSNNEFKVPLPVQATTPATKPKRKSRWGEAPVHTIAIPASKLVDMSGATPMGTPAMGMATPTPGQLTVMLPSIIGSHRGEIEMYERNRPYTDEELDEILPPGFKIIPPPEDYQPVRIAANKIIAPAATPTPMPGPLETPSTGFYMQKEENYVQSVNKIVDLEPKGNLPALKPEDLQYFDELLADVDEDSLPAEKQKERKIMKLLLKIKNGTPPTRKVALRQITDKAREFGAKALLDKILPILMSPSLEDQERHLLVKVIDRILYKLDDLVRPYVKKIMTVIAPLLIDEDYYSRIEGREVLSNLAKAAGLATMISTMRPDIDNKDESVRNTTSRAFAVVASALGIPALLPFLRAVCKSKKSWQARHTGIKIVQQTTFLMGCAILPYSSDLVKTISHGLEDEQQKVRTIAALAIAAIAEASAPYGIESFDPKTVLRPLYDGVRKFRGPVLAAYLKAIGHIIPLMDADLASMYTSEVMPTLVREFASSDKNMKEIVLKVVEQCCSTEGVQPQYIKEEVLPKFFEHYWNHRAALDKHNHRQLIATTVEMANKVGTSEIISRFINKKTSGQSNRSDQNDLKESNEEYRRMVMETIAKVITNLGAADIDERLEVLLIDGIVYAFQEQQAEDKDHIMLNGFDAVVSALGKRCKPYLVQITQIIKFGLSKSVNIRQQAADLLAKIALVMKICNEEKLMSEMGLILYENLGEEYPEVLGSILAALKAIVNVIGMHKMNPPIKDLLPKLTPILRNRHEKVQENCIDLVGRIADRGAEFGSPREWMRICFELLELLKAHKKAIRRATVNTFGYIAKAIGPHDVLATLLNNLKVQERQNRVCTTVAIAIVAETCGPFTILPALMNEYRVPELNVQNGVLKSLSFLFEYIGEMGKDYIYAILPLLQDALMDRDLVHRQTAMSVVQHMALGVHGFGCDDALTHLLNFIWPNIFETSPHVVQSFMGAIEGLRVAVGPIRLFQYTIQGLFHPARKVREVYWRIYNTLYIGGQDALVAAYPRIPNTERNEYIRYELDYII